MISECGEAEGNCRAGPAIQSRVARVAGAVAERASSTLGLLLIAFWAALAPRRAMRQAGHGLGAAVPLTREPRTIAWREPGLTLRSGGLHRS